VAKSVSLWRVRQAPPEVRCWILTGRTARSAVLLVLSRCRDNTNYADVAVMSMAFFFDDLSKDDQIDFAIRLVDLAIAITRRAESTPSYCCVRWRTARPSSCGGRQRCALVARAVAHCTDSFGR